MYYGNGNNKLEYCANANYVRYVLVYWTMLQYNASTIKIETIDCIGTVLEKKCRKKTIGVNCCFIKLAISRLLDRLIAWEVREALFAGEAN